MDNRLFAIARLLKNEETVADIGTDHGFLPIFLIENGYSKTVIASDIKEKPLAVAKKNITKKGVANKVLLRLSSGFENYKETEFTAAAIAGMGGDTIAEIIENGKDKIKNKKLVLNPVSKSNVLLTYLNNNGFAVENHFAVEDNKRLYEIIVAKTSRIKKETDIIFDLVGKLDFTNPVNQKLINKKRTTLIKKIKSIEKVERKQEELKKETARLAELNKRMGK